MSAPLSKLALLALAAGIAIALPAQAQDYIQDHYPEDDYYAQRDIAPGDSLLSLIGELERLRADGRVAEYAPDELDRAGRFIGRLEREGYADERQLLRGERLLERAERVAVERSMGDRGESYHEREVVVVEREDPRARADAEQARADAERAREEAEAEREAALAAKLEAEHARARHGQLRRELTELKTRETERGLVITLGDVLFATGKSDLKPGSRRALDQLVRALRHDRESALVVEGHTDSVGKRNYNLALSNRRAETVRRYLVRQGIPSSRIATRGLGPDFPVATNRTESGRQQNRRVELIVENERMAQDRDGMDDRE